MTTARVSFDTNPATTHEAENHHDTAEYKENDNNNNNNQDSLEQQQQQQNQPPQNNTTSTTGTSIQQHFIRSATMPMKFFLDKRKLDPAMAAMLQEYDQDGDGIFSKEEVVAILMELRQRSQANTELRAWNIFYRKLTVTMAIIFVVLLLGFLGLSVAVTSMTAKLSINEQGTAVSRSNPNTVIATNDRANVYRLDYSTTTDSNNGSRLYCLSDETTIMILNHVRNGQKVSLLFVAANDEQEESAVELTASHAEYELRSGAVTFDVTGRTLLIQSNSACGLASDGALRIGVSWLN